MKKKLINYLSGAMGLIIMMGSIFVVLLWLLLEKLGLIKVTEDISTADDDF